MNTETIRQGLQRLLEKSMAFSPGTTVGDAIAFYEGREVEMSEGDLRDDIVRLLRFLQALTDE